MPQYGKGKSKPEKGHVMKAEVDATAWVYCDKWFVNQPQEVVLNAYYSPEGVCPDFQWYDFKSEQGLCEDCQQETPVASARWADPRVAVPYKYMPQRETGSAARRMSRLNSAIGESEDSKNSQKAGKKNPFPRNHQASTWTSRPASLEDLMTAVDEQNSSLGSQALVSDSQPDPLHPFLTSGWQQLLATNPYGAIGQGRQAPRANPSGAIGQERQSARASPFGAIGQQRQPARVSPFGAIGQETQSTRASPFGAIGQGRRAARVSPYGAPSGN